MNPGDGDQSFLRDFFYELFKDSNAQREHYQLEREIWFRRLDLPRKEERLFELEMLLRAIGCFFNLHNQLIEDRDQAITRDFTAELSVLGAALERGSLLSQLLLDRGAASSFHFQSFLENQVAPDYLRLQLLRRSLDQQRPEESLFLLNRCFRDLKKLVEHMLKRPPCPYQLFYHLGQLVTREIAFNRHFNPLLILEFRPEYDRIRSVVILDAIRELRAQPERRAVSRSFLALFRLLHYLRYVPRQGRQRLLRRSLILFSLLRSEASTLAGYLRVLSTKREAIGAGLAAAAAEVATGLQAELERLFGSGSIALDTERSLLRGDRERSLATGREMLEAGLKQHIARLVRVYRPGLSVEQLFDPAANLREQSARLRTDLWLYRRLVDELLEDEAARPGRLLVPSQLVRFSGYFIDTSYNFLRYGEGGPFERYHAILTEGQRRGGGNGGWRNRFVRDSRWFRDFLQETFDLVCRRAELRSLPLDVASLEARLGRWLTATGD